MHNCLHINWSDNERPPLQLDDFISINVSGMTYEIIETTLQRFPQTLLGNKHKRQRYFIVSKNALFFNRCKQSFEAILYFYQSGGILTRPLSVPMHVFEQEVLFYKLGDDVLDTLRKEEGFIAESEDGNVDNRSEDNLFRKVWEMFEHPDSSVLGRIVSSWSMLVITVSIIVFCLETLPFFKKMVHNDHVANKLFNTTALHDDTNFQRNIVQPWYSLELGCVCWFSVEYIIRLLSSPNICTFLASYLNTIDLLAVLPYFIIHWLNTDGADTTPLSVLRVVRLVRVFRIFKLSRYSMSLKILGSTMKASLRELGMLMFFLCLGVIVFSSAMYYAEKDSNAIFVSIPDGFWFTLVTMTTVGYGDKTPQTFVGKLIGSLCALTGVLTLALPVPVIVSNFAFFYKRNRLMNANKRQNR